MDKVDLGEREAIVAWLRQECASERSIIVGYRGAGDTVGALCSGERILAYQEAAKRIERGDHLSTPNREVSDA